MDHLLDTSVVRPLIDSKARAKTPTLFAEVVAIGENDGGYHLSMVSAYEIRRGLRALELRGQGSRKRRIGDLFLRSATILSPDRAWDIAVDLWARGNVSKPALKIADADLLIASVAIAEGRTLVTADAELAGKLSALGVTEVKLLAMA